MKNNIFQIDTNWVVITGAPSSGKTSVIDVLARRGYATWPETARQVIEEKLKSGQTIKDIRRPELAAALQKEILMRKENLEHTLDPAQQVFLDRGMPDSLSYFRLANIADLTSVRNACLRFRYRQVFIFDRLPMVHDAVRSENEETAKRLDTMIEEDYRSLGYTPIRVGVMTIEERADFVLARSALSTPAESAAAL